ncbi:MAG: hypothetical protein LIP04_14030 [Tannerellaceae bacterium]|nr:hypothetical protein [Tannerellaceae bacterium]
MKQQPSITPLHVLSSQPTAQLKKNNVFEEDTDFLKRPTYRGHGLVSFDDLEAWLSATKDYAHTTLSGSCLSFNEETEGVRTVAIREAVHLQLDLSRLASEQVVYLHNISSGTIRQPLPADAYHRSLSGDSIEIPPDRICEIRVSRYDPFYVISGMVQPG